MKTKIFLILFAVLFGGAVQSQEFQRPNIVFIFADDMGYGDVSALNPNGKIRTPQIDRLAAAGRVFTDMHSCSSVCTPSRYGFLTGRYNWRSTLQQGVISGYAPPLIKPDRMTVASMLKSEGYHTALIGKWHLGLDWAKRDNSAQNSVFKNEIESQIDFSKPFTNGPNELGFDYFFGISAALDMPPFVYLENNRVVQEPTTRKQWLREGPAAEDFEAVDVLPKITEKAVDYIKSKAEGAKQGTPFFLFFSLNAPHTPIIPSPAWSDVSELKRPYPDFIMQLDDSVGRVITAIDQSGLTNNTIVIFTADNGCSAVVDTKYFSEHGHHPSGVFRGYKADIYEGGHRVPFVIRWPDKIKSGSTSHQLACQTDMMRTFADILGKQLPDTAAEDSVSLLPDWIGTTTTSPLRSEIIHHSFNGSFAIRQGPWKLCLCPDSGGWNALKPDSPEAAQLPKYQLFNLQTDISETTNLLDSYPELVRSLELLLKTFIKAGRSTYGTVQRNDVEVGAMR